MTLGAVLLEHLQKYSHPTAVDLSNKLYVDNLLSGVENEADAITYFEKAREILREGHFTLRQWSTNSAALQEATQQKSCLKCRKKQMLKTYMVYLNSDKKLSCQFHHLA